MKTAVKRAVAATLVAAAAGTGMTLGATDAEAARYGIAGGTYTWTQVQNWGPYSKVTGKAWVRGNVMTLKPNNRGAATVRFRIVPTRTGGYTDPGFGSRFVFNRKAGGRYSGPSYTFGIPSGSVRLTPR